jgi:ribosome-binding factor A
MGTRLNRVEALLCREIADVVLFGNLRDPRLQPTSAISITGVQVSADLSSARVFVDLLSQTMDPAEVLDGLNAGSAAVRRRIAGRVQLKRIPSLEFLRDESIERGASIERVLQELHDDARSSGEGQGEDGED